MRKCSGTVALAFMMLVSTSALATEEVYDCPYNVVPGWNQSITVTLDRDARFMSVNWIADNANDHEEDTYSGPIIMTRQHSSSRKSLNYTSFEIQYFNLVFHGSGLIELDGIGETVPCILSRLGTGQAFK